MSNGEPEADAPRGLIAAAVRNPVAVNLIMVAMIVGGFMAWGTLVRELLPNSEPEQIVVTVPYPGATPDEVEKSVALPIERELTGLSGVDEVSAEILEGACAVRVSLEAGADQDRVLNEVRNEVDSVSAELPDGAEDPEITALRPFFPVISVYVSGEVSEERLRGAALDVRDALVDLAGISEVTLAGTRDREIWIEIDVDALEEHGLTYADVGAAVAQGNLDLPGGQLESDRGNVRVRTVGERERSRALEDLVVRADDDGSVVRLRDVARVRDTFEDKIERGRYQGRPAASITVFKTPEQDAIEIADRVKAYVAAHPSALGGAVTVEAGSDLSRFVVQRLDLMLRNARAGLLLVCIALALFLDVRVAFWVALGLPVAFLGTFVAMLAMGMTINLISLFGLIVVLGLIVDDAIVIAENIFTKIRAGAAPMRAAIEGTTEVGLPVLAAVSTSIAAFAPLAFLGGRLGTFLKQMPLVVMAALGVSLIEAFVILPAHLGHGGERNGRLSKFISVFTFDGRTTRWRAAWMERILPSLVERALRMVLRWRYVAVAALIAISAIVAGGVAGGHPAFVLFPGLDAEDVAVDLEMAAGTPVEATEAVIASIERNVLALPEVNAAFSVVGSSFSERGRETAADPATVGQINVSLLEADERESRGLRASGAVVAELREASSSVPGVAKLTFQERAGGPEGADIELRVRGEDPSRVERAVDHIRDVLSEYEGVHEVEDDLRRGKLEAQLHLRDDARAIGLTTQSLALQIRHALFGFEAQDLQEADGEVTVRVVLPEHARTSLSDLSRLRVNTPSGSRVPLSEVATLRTARGYASLARVDGKRAITVKASIDDSKANVAEVTGDVRRRIGSIGERFPGVSVTFEGRQKETRESVGSLVYLFPLALLVIYGILATVFKSYVQPLLVMAAIPYAFVGAVVGHLIMGLPFTLLSMIGGVALAGIVVNDSLILVDFVNRIRVTEKLSVIEAVVRGARARVRAILLTSVTTVCGLAPIMLERSFQAQFLIPMAVSIVFGLAFATVLTLIVLPTFYVILEDVRSAVRWWWTGDSSVTRSS